VFATSDSPHHYRVNQILEKGADDYNDDDTADRWLSDNILAHLLRSIVFSDIRQQLHDPPDASSSTRGDPGVDRKRGRSYIGRRSSSAGHSTEKRAADRERVYIGKRTRWSSPAIN